MNLFAQATDVPNNGASNAEDFQPLTRNPQTSQGGLQSGTGPQSTSGQDILSNENARIVVPTGNAQTAPPPAATPNGAGVNWFLVVAVAAVIVIALEYVFRRREKRNAASQKPARSTPQEVITLPADESPSADESSETLVKEEATEDRPEEAEESKAEKPKKKSSSKSGAKKKSKSKRKKSRK